MIFSQPNSESNSCDEQLFPLVMNLIEDVVLLQHRLLVDLPHEVGGGVGWLRGAVQLKKITNLRKINPK